MSIVIKMSYSSTVLLLCHLSKVIKFSCYCQIFKLFLIIVFLITVLYINNYLTLNPIKKFGLILPSIKPLQFLLFTASLSMDV
jgi:hypothetical protein